MWLINNETFKLEYFMGQAPSYAILSHTWGPEEVTFADFHNDMARRSKAGFAKIKLTCEQARTDGIKYSWVDTCCINKESSAELSEAINSMFKWYRLAAVCYAYLEDFPQEVEIADSSSLGWCRWFSRGWTLQELIAPKRLVFFAPNVGVWRTIGRKDKLYRELEDITKIPRAILLHQKAIETISVATRMSWAAKRQTTREEDLAYCLMGIFKVNMPLLYGEGAKAFIRLQEGILREVPDNSLFAWRSTEEAAARTPYRGLFACSPDEFSKSAGIKSFDVANDEHEITASVLGQGRISFCCSMHEVPNRNDRVVLSLNCFRGDLSDCQGIQCVQVGPNHYIRSEPSKLYRCSGGSLRSVTIDKHAMKTRASKDEHIYRPAGVDEHVYRPDRVDLRGMCGRMYLRHVLSEKKLGDTQAPPHSLSVPFSWAAGRKMAFEVGIKRPESTLAEDRFLILFWVDALRRSEAHHYHFNLEKCKRSAHDGDAQLRLATAIKPSKSYGRCSLDFGPYVISVEKSVLKEWDTEALVVNFCMTRKDKFISTSVNKEKELRQWED